MKLAFIQTICLCALGIGLGALTPAAVADEPANAADGAWPQWRGPNGNGVAPHGDPPTTWSEGQNIRWKVEIPGRGHASPIVWGDRIYIQTAIKTDKLADAGQDSAAPEPPAEGRRGRRGSPPPTHIHQYMLLALDRATGKTIWQKTLCEALPAESGHQNASPASASPVTDGEHILAHFGSQGLYALDMAGNVLWHKELGRMTTRGGFGEGASPALHGDTVVINWDHEGDSFIVALDKRTGEERWRVARDERTSWATPVFVTAGGRVQVVVNGANRIRAYDLATGEVVWQCDGMTENVVPTPVWDDKRLYCLSGFRGAGLVAIRYGEARGEITNTSAVAWIYDGKGTPYVPSPALYDGALYFLAENREQLSCVDARTGRVHYSRERLDGLDGVYASIVAANGHVYVVGRNGKTAVLAHGPELRTLATNELDDSFTASPAIAGRELFLRGHKYLYCIAEP
ncbi:MAG: PQQ-binding-like beta-propeller repeat protein [Phycisphaerae bacterium]|jgi:outer membrane protein assembly factor BamB